MYSSYACDHVYENVYYLLQEDGKHLKIPLEEAKPESRFKFNNDLDAKTCELILLYFKRLHV